MFSEILSSVIVDAKIRDALTNHPTKKDVDNAMKLKQDALTQSQVNAMNSGVTGDLVDKLKNIEAGAQKNPDLSPYAKKTELPVVPDMSKYALNEKVEAEEVRAIEAERNINLKVESIEERVNSKVGADWVMDRFVEREIGKGLSEYNFGIDEKLKLEGIEEGAQKNPDLTPYTKTEDIPDLVKDKQDFIYIESKYGKWIAISGLPKGFKTIGEPSNGGVGDDIVRWEAESNDGEILFLASFGNDNLASGSETLDDVTKLEPFYIYSSRDDVQYDETVKVRKIKRIAAEITSSDDSLVLRGEVLPRYPFADAVLDDGVITVAPYANAKLVSDGTAFEVAVGGESGYTRDCVFRVECGDTAPTITWPDNFHPRTDAEADFACVANVRNVYWITEHAKDEFCVAGWQETEGGNAQ